MRRLFLIAFFLEVGFALIVVPWSGFWDGNYFAQVLPLVGDVIGNDFVRGAVSGIGVVTVVTGLSDLVSLFMARGQSLEAPRLPRSED
ncbi:MAG: hypothetical protein ABL986_04160 [Vicinamibacterales bacterium]